MSRNTCGEKSRKGKIKSWEWPSVEETDFVGVRCPGGGNSSMRDWARITCRFRRTPWQADILQGTRSSWGGGLANFLWKQHTSVTGGSEQRYNIKQARGKLFSVPWEVSLDHALLDILTWDMWRGKVGGGGDATGLYPEWNSNVGSSLSAEE